MKTFLKIFLTIICVGGIGGLIFYSHYVGKDLYNTGYVNGNSAGNLYNHGLFCEYDGIIYFANLNDGYRLYQMNRDGTGVKKISDDSVAFINVDENYIYYTRTGDSSESRFAFLHVNTHSLCKLRRDLRGEVVVLDADPSMYATLVGNYIYYIHYTAEESSTLYRIKNDGEEKTQVFPQPYYTCSTQNQYIYYNGLEKDHNVYRLDTTNNTQSLLYEGNCWMPIVDGNYLYFMDCENSYKLARVDLTTNEKILLTDEWVDCFNIYNGTIYFQRNTDSPALCSIRTDGSNYTVLKEGIYTNINIAGNLIFFKDFHNELFYKISITDGWVSSFNPAVEKD